MVGTCDDSIPTAANTTAAANAGPQVEGEGPEAAPAGGNNQDRRSCRGCRSSGRCDRCAMLYRPRGAEGRVMAAFIPQGAVHLDCGGRCRIVYKV